MRYCYICGRAVPAAAPSVRRKVRTGEARRKPNRSRFPTSTIRFGMRVVCPWCAKKVDAERRREELVQFVEVGIALPLLAVVLLTGLFSK